MVEFSSVPRVVQRSHQMLVTFGRLLYLLLQVKACWTINGPWKTQIAVAVQSTTSNVGQACVVDSCGLM